MRSAVSIRPHNHHPKEEAHEQTDHRNAKGRGSPPYPQARLSSGELLLNLLPALRS